MRTLKTASIFFERCLLVAGGMLLAIWLAAFLDGKISSRFALWSFANAQATAVPKNDASKSSDSSGNVDFSLWAEKRIQAYKDSLLIASSMPVAVLEIDKVKIHVPVFEGTDDLTLNRGVGRIAGTAMPGVAGNIGIAGHRDGFFRGLKDIAVGDQIDLVMTTERVTYIVDQIEIVSPTDVNVLQPRATSSLTLVTCYPFYFVGDAPQRFIVHASIVSHGPTAGSRNQPTTTSAGLGKNNKEN
ncbi:MAG: class D sortase [Acidobacteriaceae bacterium]